MCQFIKAFVSRNDSRSVSCLHEPILTFCRAGMLRLQGAGAGYQQLVHMEANFLSFFITFSSFILGKDSLGVLLNVFKTLDVIFIEHPQCAKHNVCYLEKFWLFKAIVFLSYRRDWILYFSFRLAMSVAFCENAIFNMLTIKCGSWFVYGGNARDLWVLILFLESLLEFTDEL